MSKNTVNPSKRILFDELDESTQPLPWAYPLEINSGAIELSAAHKALFHVQANTSKGLWNLHSIPESLVGSDELREFLEDLERRHRTPPVYWTTRSPTVLVRGHRASVQAASLSEMPLEACLRDNEEVVDDWRASPSETLTKLLESSTTHNELFDAILFAEITVFDKDQTERLLPRLFAFIAENRLSSDDDVQTVVGAAIRKLATNLPETQFEQYADLFLPTDTDTLPHEIELELAKAILWRLTNVPAIHAQRFSKLEGRLSELALDYLRPRLILQKNYASIALHATLGALLLNGEQANSVVKGVSNLGISWFLDLCRRRLSRLCVQVEQHGEKGSEATAAQLRRYEAMLRATSNEDDTAVCQHGD